MFRFVLSSAQARLLLQPALQSAAATASSLLDVGAGGDYNGDDDIAHCDNNVCAAGDGEVTFRMSYLFTSVTATEVSARM